MKNSVRLFFVMLTCLMSFPSYAQTFGIKAGFNLSNVLDKDDFETYSNDYKVNPGFHIGTFMDAPFSEVLSINVNLLLSTKGFRVEDTFSGVDVTSKANLFYLDLPVTLKAAHELGGGIKMFAELGPYLGVGISGTVKAEGMAQGVQVTEKENVKWGGDENNDDVKRLDFGAAIGGGVEINNFLAGIYYDLGLANISPYTDEGTVAKNRVLRFSVGYRFGD